MKNITKELERILIGKVITRHYLPGDLVAELDVKLSFKLSGPIVWTFADVLKSNMK